MTFLSKIQKFLGEMKPSSIFDKAPDDGLKTKEDLLELSGTLFGMNEKQYRGSTIVTLELKEQPFKFRVSAY
jgi:hypothetical protein